MAFLAKRRSERRRFKETIVIRSRRGTEYAFSEDLSAEGMLLCSENPYDEGESVILEFSVKNAESERRPVVLRAKVTRCVPLKPDTLCALQFQQLSSEAVQHLRSFIDATPSA